MPEGAKTIATNRKASHDYNLQDRFEAGMQLMGSEIKSIRAKGVSLQEAYVTLRDNELWVLNMHIVEYKEASYQGHDPRRPRKLLLHRREINSIASDLTLKGYTLVPTKLYLRGGLAKLEIALATGKKKYDKRQTIRERDDKRRVERALKDY
jgi:SsrA-binding protein